MNTRVLLVSSLLSLALAGCGQKGPSTSADSGGSSASASTSTTSTEATASTSTSASDSTAATAADTAGARTIKLTASDQMRYNLTSIEAKPGETLTVELTNTGSLPKEAMAHNWVLLKPGNDPMAFSAAAATHKDEGYIPASLKNEIIAFIPLQGPHETGSVTFKAPDQPGEYPFLCSFPGHAALMKGTLTVK